WQYRPEDLSQFTALVDIIARLRAPALTSIAALSNTIIEIAEQPYAFHKIILL
ncbi:unnamed protein product, partial [marine sediment metagenome]